MRLDIAFCITILIGAPLFSQNPKTGNKKHIAWEKKMGQSVEFILLDKEMYTEFDGAYNVAIKNGKFSSLLQIVNKVYMSLKSHEIQPIRGIFDDSMCAKYIELLNQLTTNTSDYLHVNGEQYPRTEVIRWIKTELPPFILEGYACKGLDQKIDLAGSGLWLELLEIMPELNELLVPRSVGEEKLLDETATAIPEVTSRKIKDALKKIKPSTKHMQSMIHRLNAILDLYNEKKILFIQML